jgi:hypothetical protein
MTAPDEQPWTEWITRELDRGDFPEFTLVCTHGSVTSEQLKQLISVDYVVALLRQLRTEYPDVSVSVLIIGEIRLLLGWMLSAASRCECASQPWVVVFDPQVGYRVEDVR